MAAGTGNLVEAARETGVRRIVLMSALGTGPGATVPYFRAKWAAEQAVAGSGIEHVVLRPSFVFGADGGALPRFLRIARLAPVTPRDRPGDAARSAHLDRRRRPRGALAVDARRPRTPDRARRARRRSPGTSSGGAMKAALGHPPPGVHVPFWLARGPAALFERMPPAL